LTGIATFTSSILFIQIKLIKHKNKKQNKKQTNKQTHKAQNTKTINMQMNKTTTISYDIAKILIPMYCSISYRAL
jgi:hypothetical protein